jgi:hypothetical protein
MTEIESAVLVPGLPTASAKTIFDTTNNDMRSYATSIIELDTARKLLRADTAAAIMLGALSIVTIMIGSQPLRDALAYQSR